MRTPLINLERIWTRVTAKNQTLQHRDEFLPFLKFLLDNKVKSVLEIGCFEGGTAKMFLECGMKVVSIDIDPTPKAEQIDHQGFTLLKGDSRDYYIAEALSTIFEEFDLVWIDGDHSYEGCRSDFSMYRAFASKFIAFHDIKDFERCEVPKVWEEVKAENPGATFKEFKNKDRYRGIGVLCLK